MTLFFVLCTLVGMAIGSLLTMLFLNVRELQRKARELDELKAGRK